MMGTGSTDRTQNGSAVKDKLTKSFLLILAAIKHISVHVDSPNLVPQHKECFCTFIKANFFTESAMPGAADKTAGTEAPVYLFNYFNV